tara:strand:+ start:93 stop:530 length:438 start_codon:yes stop_codon:yes gene_type:complete
MNVNSSDKYLYFRVAATAGAEDDEATGSTYYPVSALRGMCSGTSDQKGAVTDDADALSLFLTPKASTGAGGDADDAQGDNVDVVIIGHTTDNNQKAIMDTLINEIVFGNSAIITVFDGGAGGASAQIHSDIVLTECSILHVENAD